MENNVIRIANYDFDDDESEASNSDEFRVEGFDQFIGQQRLKESLGVRLDAARQQDRPLDHMLLWGPPGFGKTSLATIVATRLGVPFKSIQMPITERVLADLVECFHGVLLFDEVHSAPKPIMEALLPLLEFGYVENKRGIRVDAERLTIIGATTEPEKIIVPLYDRFAIKPDFDAYSDDEMGQIVTGMAVKGRVTLSEATAVALGRATGGTPRKARDFVLAARDLAVTGREPTAEAVLYLCRIDPDGITYQHSEYLKALYRLGGIAGLNTLRNILRLSESVVRELERLLLARQFIAFTERGRELTRQGREKIKGAKT